MKKLIVLLMLVSVGLSAQTTTIQFKRGALSALPTDYTAGEPLWVQDSLDFYIGDSTNSRNQYVGGRSSQYSKLWFGNDTGSTDTYAVTLPIVPTTYLHGYKVHFRANTANTGAATLNVNSIGAIAIRKNGTSVLGDNDISAGQIVTVVYDDSNDVFQLQGSLASFSSVGEDIVPSSANTYDLGSSAKPFDTVYTRGLQVTGQDPKLKYVYLPDIPSYEGFDINVYVPATHSDSVFLMGFYLDDPMIVSGFAIGEGNANGAIGGPSFSRHYTLGIYNSSGALQATTAPQGFTGTNIGVNVPLATVDTIGPGWYYVAITNTLSGTATDEFYGPLLTGNSAYGQMMLVAQSSTYPMFAYAPELSSSGVLPNTVTITPISAFLASGTQGRYPYVILLGQSVD